MMSSKPDEARQPAPSRNSTVGRYGGALLAALSAVALVSDAPGWSLEPGTWLVSAVPVLMLLLGLSLLLSPSHPKLGTALAWLSALLAAGYFIVQRA